MSRVHVISRFTRERRTNASGSNLNDLFSMLCLALGASSSALTLETIALLGLQRGKSTIKIDVTNHYFVRYSGVCKRGSAITIDIAFHCRTRHGHDTNATTAEK